MLKFLLCHIHFIQSYYNNGANFSVYWLGPQTKIFPSSWFCLKEALIGVYCGKNIPWVHNDTQLLVSFKFVNFTRNNDLSVFPTCECDVNFIIQNPLQVLFTI